MMYPAFGLEGGGVVLGAKPPSGVSGCRASRQALPLPLGPAAHGGGVNGVTNSCSQALVG